MSFESAFHKLVDHLPLAETLKVELHDEVTSKDEEKSDTDTPKGDE